VSYYRGDHPSRRSRSKQIARVLAFLLLSAVGIALAAVGGIVLWLDQSLSTLQARSPAVKRAERQLAVSLPGRPAIALLLGDNQRAGFERSAGGRSDTIMLVRADPAAKTISLLSIPRDLQVPVYCPGSGVPRATTRIDYAFAWCGPAGSLDTIRRLTGLPINYLITVDFHGFKEIVNDLGGVWLDIDRRYYNHNVGTASSDYSNIDLQPGYQLLSGGSALEFVRFRHTDSDFYRVARQQEFLRALKDQVARNFDPLQLPRIVSDIVQNIQVGAKRSFSPTTVLEYALFAVTLPHGHILQDYVSRNQVADTYVGGADELAAAPGAIQQAVRRFTHPAKSILQPAPPAHRRHRPQAHAPSSHATTVTVLNGNGVPGAAAMASYLLSRRGYHAVPPPAGAAANAPSASYSHSAIYYEGGSPASRAAASALATLFAPADALPLPTDRRLLSLDPGSMVLVVVGQTFHGQLTERPAVTPARPVPPAVRADPAPGLALLHPITGRVPFTVETPTVLEESSQPDTLPGDVPLRVYDIDGRGGHKAVRLVFVTADRAFWGIEETNMPDPPALDDRSTTRRLGGRTFQLYYSGKHLNMVVLRHDTVSHWVMNSLLDELSNQTMMAIAVGLKPLSAHN
jgi:LCP family protein required for cell wall assembly